MNALDTPVNTQAFGKWFQWKPRQIKEIQNINLAMFLTEKRGEDGLVGIDDKMMEMEKDTPEAKAEFAQYIEDRRKEGVQKRIQKLDGIIHNLEVSLKRDLDRANLKQDPLVEASKGELSAYKERASLMEYERQQAVNVADEIRKVKAQMNGEPVNGSGSDTQS
jgi:hypothetical protein